MSRFGEISSVWLKFPKVFGNFSKALLVFDNILNLFWQTIAIGQIFNVENGQIMKHNQPIWSLWQAVGFEIQWYNRWVGNLNNKNWVHFQFPPKNAWKPTSCYSSCCGNKTHIRNKLVKKYQVRNLETLSCLNELNGILLRTLYSHYPVFRECRLQVNSRKPVTN